uniref:Hexosyltransferase n=1 Tax=Leptobrachium leishanense TaxID=445787 RepID=A0A8C5M310_9ANUR
MGLERSCGGCCRTLYTILLMFIGVLVVLVLETILSKLPRPQDHLKTHKYNAKVTTAKIDIKPSRHPMVPPYPYPYEFIINQEDKCSGRNPFLVALVISRSQDVAARNAIRKTWGNASNYDSVDIVTVFLIGLSPIKSHEFQQMLEEESMTFRDIIQQNFLDTYLNLTLKTVMGMEWVSKFCTSASYVMKIDSDVFLNVEYLVHQILRPDLPVRHNYFLGQVYIGARPRRNKMDKWYVPLDVYPNETYPPYCDGSVYVFSVDMAKKIYGIAQVVSLMPFEDVSVGLCLKELHIVPIEYPGDAYRRSEQYNHCTFKARVGVHMEGKSDFKKIWQELWSNQSVPCES